MQVTARGDSRRQDPGPRHPPEFKTKLHRHWRRHARHARVKAAARARSGTRGNGGKPGLELAGAWRRRRWVCLHGRWRHRRRRHRPSAPPRRTLVVPGCRDNTASAQDGAWDKQWRRCGDPEQTFAKLGEDGYDGELAPVGAAPTHGGPCWEDEKGEKEPKRMRTIVLTCGPHYLASNVASYWTKTR
uniref:Uncharacterized protein n=1 Tax=Oryza meridionalis TaxID=40149 RepID=A0A0E0CF18_9ORYZ